MLCKWSVIFLKNQVTWLTYMCHCFYVVCAAKTVWQLTRLNRKHKQEHHTTHHPLTTYISRWRSDGVSSISIILHTSIPSRHKHRQLVQVTSHLAMVCKSWVVQLWEKLEKTKRDFHSLWTLTQFSHLQHTWALTFLHQFSLQKALQWTFGKLKNKITII